MARLAGVITVLDKTAAVADAIRYIAEHRAMVGVPAEKSSREGGGVSNAMLAYVHENGAPEVHVPARPHLKPGVLSVQDKTESDLVQAARLALGGDQAVETYYHRIGLRAVSAIRNKIRGKIPPPLAPSTIQGRVRRSKSASRRQKIRERLAYSPSAAWSMFTPLIDTGAYIKAITYVIRKVKI